MPAYITFRGIFQEDSIKKLFLSSIKYNGAMGIDRVNSKSFENNIDNHISIILRKSLSGTYSFSQYKEKLISRGPFRYPRVISIPTIRDKLTLKALFQVLYSVYGNELPFLHRIVGDIIRSISEDTYDGVLRLDVKDFYPSIKHDLLMSQIRKRIRKKEILHLIENSISRKTVAKPIANKRHLNRIGVPQGLSISNILANVYMQPIDKKYNKWTSLRYFRYVDDILILCNIKRIDQIKNSIINDCEKIGLSLHEDNSSKMCEGEICSGFNYLGYVFGDGSISVRKKSLDNLRESIIKIFTNYKYSDRKDEGILCWVLNTRITGCIFNETKYGWLFFFSQINDFQLLSSLDHFVRKQILKAGLDPSSLSLKRFTRAYHEITKNLNNTKYIPNYDNTSLQEKRRILRDIFDIKAYAMRENEIEYLFKKKLFRTVKELEKDLARPS